MVNNYGNIGGMSFNPGQWANNAIDRLVPGDIERFLPLPRYHPWIFGAMMFTWGMARQSALDKGPGGEYKLLGLNFPMVRSLGYTSAQNMGALGRASGSTGLMAVIGFGVIAILAQTVQDNSGGMN